MLSKKTIQSDFPSLEGRAYLNTAAEGIPPKPVLAALRQYGEDKLLGMDGRKLHEVQWEEAKQLLGRQLHLTPDEVSICSCSSEAYNLAALALRLKENDEVVINDLDFPSGATPWLQTECPATVQIWRARDWRLRIEDLIQLLTPRTRLVTVSLVSFFNGFRLPLAETVEAVRRHSKALLAVDVTQALGRVELDLAGVDLVISSTHKWLLASHGGGLVGVPRARAADWTVPAGGWFNLENAFAPDRFDRAVPRPGAAGFTVGMPNYPAVYAIRAALAYLEETGVGQIEKRTAPLMEACLEGLRKLPVELITPVEPEARAGILAFRHPKSPNLHRFLHERNVHIMEHAGRLRVSVHGYNSMEDVSQFLTTLKEALDHV